MQQDTSHNRSQSHAKLFDTDRGQVLAYLNRDENDALTVLLQMWVDHTDEPLRALIRGENDDVTLFIFESLDDEGVPQVIDELGMVETIAEIEAGNG